MSNLMNVMRLSRRVVYPHSTRRIARFLSNPPSLDTNNPFEQESFMANSFDGMSQEPFDKTILATLSLPVDSKGNLFDILF